MPVRVERHGPVTTVVLARPDVANAVDRETALALALADAFAAFDADDGARAAVLCGEGPNFCAGADLKAVAAGDPNRVEPDGDAPMGPSRMLLSKPVVAAIGGHAVAGGLELALWCDLRVADEDVVLGVFCRRWGVPLIDGGTVRLPRLRAARCASALIACCGAASIALALALALAPALALALAASATGDDPRPHAANNSFRASLISECVRAVRPQRLRALGFDGAQLPRSVAAGHEPGSRPRCRPGELRLLRLQALSIGGERTYVRRGGCALPCVRRQATVHIPASALVRPVSLLSHAARNGNGEPVADCNVAVVNAPALVGPELRRMYYKTPAELRLRRNAGRSGGIGANWSNYGDPGATYRSPAGRRAHYNYLLWNLPRAADGLLPGGGIVEAILTQGQRLMLCPAERLTLPAFDRGGALNGAVDFGYARVRSAGRPSYPIYGWVLLGYRYLERTYVTTIGG